MINYSTFFKECNIKSLVDDARLNVLEKYAQSVRHLAGDIAEVGVYQGGSAYVIKKTLLNKPIHLFDTFTGIPSSTMDGIEHNIGDFDDTSYEIVSNFLSCFNDVKIYPGLFPDTAQSLINTKFCFVHIDGDIYQTAKDGLEFFWPRLVKGGIIMFDDWQWDQTKYVKKAIWEFFSDKLEEMFMFQEALVQVGFRKVI